MYFLFKSYKYLFNEKHICSKMSKKTEKITLRVDISNALIDEFLTIKSALALKNYSEVIRILIHNAYLNMKSNNGIGVVVEEVPAR